MSWIPHRANSFAEMFLSRASSGLFMVMCLSVGRTARAADFHALHPLLRCAAREIDVQKSVLEPGAGDFDAVGQDERALKLARGDAAMEIDPVLVVDLLAADDQLVVFDLHCQVVHGEAGDGER